MEARSTVPTPQDSRPSWTRGGICHDAGGKLGDGSAGRGHAEEGGGSHRNGPVSAELRPGCSIRRVVGPEDVVAAGETHPGGRGVAARAGAGCGAGAMRTWLATGSRAGSPCWSRATSAKSETASSRWTCGQSCRKAIASNSVRAALYRLATIQPRAMRNWAMLRQWAGNADCATTGASAPRTPFQSPRCQAASAAAQDCSNACRS